MSGRLMCDSTSMAELLNIAIRVAVQLVKVDLGQIYMYDSQQGKLILSASFSIAEQYTCQDLEPEEGLYGNVFESGEPVIVDRAQYGHCSTFNKPFPHSKLVVPVAWDEQIIGIIVFVSYNNQRNLSQEDIEFSQLCANLIAITIENTKLYTKIQSSLYKLRGTLQQEVAERTMELAKQVTVMRSCPVDVEAISTLSNDELLDRVVELKIAKKVLVDVDSKSMESVSIKGLTLREVEVLTFVAKGLSNKEIASKLFVSVSTVKFHVSSILGKLHFGDRTQAALWAVNQGLVNAADTPFRPLERSSPSICKDNYIASII